MPSIVLSPVKITSVSTNSNVTFGDILNVQPSSTSKSIAGAGGSNTGDFVQTNTLISLTNTLDPDFAEGNTIG